MTCPLVLEVPFPMSSSFQRRFETLSKLKILMGMSTVQDAVSMEGQETLDAGANRRDTGGSCAMKEWLKALVTDSGACFSKCGFSSLLAEKSLSQWLQNP